MTTTSIRVDRSALVPQEAIVLYTMKRDHRNYQSGAGQVTQALATVHKVRQQGAMPVMGPGKLMDQRRLRSMMGALGMGTGLHLLPANVLAWDGSTLVWWVPPGKQRVWFNSNDERLGQRTGEVNHPGLVFSVGHGGWQVWAVEGKERPDAHTQLMQAPYLNVYLGGPICVGNVDLPRVVSPDSIPALNAAFFGSRFTHPNVSKPGALTKFRGGVVALWASMLDKPGRRFPQRSLVALDMTLAKKLDSLQGGRK